MKGNKVRLNSDRSKAWKVIRGLTGVFTATEIATVAEADYGNIVRYMRVLREAGYLRSEGRHGHQQTYRLIKNTCLLYTSPSPRDS